MTWRQVGLGFVVLLAVTAIAWAAITRIITDEVIESDGYHRFPGGIAIGDETRSAGCINWSEIDLCFFVDLNCNYLRDVGETLMCSSESTNPPPCLDLGTACTLNSDCCTGTCDMGFCVVGCGCNPCVTIGGPCMANDECCTGLCVDTFCARCIDMANPCTSNVDCCSGQCVGGVCANSGGEESTTSTSSSSTTTTSTSSTTSTSLSFEAFAQGACFDVLGLRPESDLLFPWIAPGNQTITSVGCHCLGECASPRATLALIDGIGNLINLTSTLTCGTGIAATTFVTTDASDADRDLVAGERFGITVTNTPASYDEVTVCVTF